MYENDNEALSHSLTKHNEIIIIMILLEHQNNIKDVDINIHMFSNNAIQEKLFESVDSNDYTSLKVLEEHS